MRTIKQVPIFLLVMKSIESFDTSARLTIGFATPHFIRMCVRKNCGDRCLILVTRQFT